MKAVIKIFPLLILCFGLNARAQDFDFSKELNVGHIKDYQQSVRQSPDKKLVEITTAKSGILLDIRYATKNNFMHRPMYTQARAFTRLPVYKALLQIEAGLKEQGLGLKIFDGYRPYSVTVKFYKMAHNPDFVANPKEGSRHNRGCAVDLTLIDLKTGKDLEMPTGYDSFSPAAAADYSNLGEQAIKNRELLKSIMQAHGFTVLPTEWWHFDYNGWENYELLDIPFSKL